MSEKSRGKYATAHDTGTREMDFLSAAGRGTTAEDTAISCRDPYRIRPSSAALQNVLGHMGAVAMRFTRFVWSPNMWIVSFTVRSWTCTLESAAPVIRIRSPA